MSGAQTAIGRRWLRDVRRSSPTARRTPAHRGRRHRPLFQSADGGHRRDARRSRLRYRSALSTADCRGGCCLALHAELASRRRRGRRSVRIRPTDRQRILRALEVLEATGRSRSPSGSGRRTRPRSSAERGCCVLRHRAAARRHSTSASTERFDRMVVGGGHRRGRGVACAWTSIRRCRS